MKHLKLNVMDTVEDASKWRWNFPAALLNNEIWTPSSESEKHISLSDSAKATYQFPVGSKRRREENNGYICSWFSSKWNEPGKRVYWSESSPYIQQERLYDLQRLNNVEDLNSQRLQELVTLKQRSCQNEFVQRLKALLGDNQNGKTFPGHILFFKPKSHY